MTENGISWTSHGTRVIAVGVLLIGGSCQNTTPTPLDENALMAQSVVQIRTNTGRGTGFVLSYKAGGAKRVIIATAAHVIADSTQISVLHEERLDNGTVFRSLYPDVQVLAADFYRDLAILEVPNLPAKTLRPLELDADQCGAVKRGWGYPATVFSATGELGLAFKDLNPQQPLKLAAEERFGPEFRELAKDKVRGVVFAPHLDRGNSGGPIVSSNNKVVAVTTMRSRSEDQGAGVCVSELLDLLAEIKPHAVTRESVKGLLKRTFEAYLPAADQAGATQTVRDYVPPSAIANARSAFQSVLIGTALSSNSFYDTFSIFDRAFPGALENIAERGKSCRQLFDEGGITCWIDLTTRPVAHALLRHKVSGSAAVRDIEVVDEPKRVSENPPEYDVIVKWSASDGRVPTSTIRIRDEWGKLWVVPADVQTVWEMAQKAWEGAGDKFIGRWAYETSACNGRYELEVKRKDDRLAATATVSGGTGCTMLISADYQVDRDSDLLSLRLIPPVRDQSRCGWQDDITLDLKMLSDGRLHFVKVNGKSNYSFCQGAEPLVFTRIKP